MLAVSPRRNPPPITRPKGAMSSPMIWSPLGAMIYAQHRKTAGTYVDGLTLHWHVPCRVGVSGPTGVEWMNASSLTLMVGRGFVSWNTNSILLGGSGPPSWRTGMRATQGHPSLRATSAFKLTAPPRANTSSCNSDTPRCTCEQARRNAKLFEQYWNGLRTVGSHQAWNIIP